MSETVYQLKVTLMGTQPVVWRRILVDKETFLPELHYIIQACMGWTDSHLHQFAHEDKYYSEPDDDWGGEVETIDYEDVILGNLLTNVGDTMIYTYDFGDDWTHEILLENVMEDDGEQMIPICLEGQNACPPEDCGGIPGYYNMLEILKDPKHEEHEDLKEWIGGEFDPTFFDLEEANEVLEAGYADEDDEDMDW